MTIRRTIIFILSVLIYTVWAQEDISLHEPEDFLQLTSKVQTALSQTQAATVCLEIGEGGSGSGVIVSEGGLILSAAHVTQEVGKELSVVMSDGTRYKAIGLGLDTSYDASMAQIVR